MTAARAAATTEQTRDAMKVAFGRALADALAVRGLKQADLADALTTTQSAVSAWITGKSEPTAWTVFAAETVIGVTPGGLSRLLGYLPLEAAGAPPSVEDCIAQSTQASDDQKRMVITVWRSVVDQHRNFLRLVADQVPKNGAHTSRARTPQSRRPTRQR